MENKNNNIDEILSQLKSDRTRINASDGSEVDEILSSLGLSTPSKDTNARRKVEETRAASGDRYKQQTPLASGRADTTVKKPTAKPAQTNRAEAGQKKEQQEKEQQEKEQTQSVQDKKPVNPPKEKEEKKPQVKYIQPDSAPLTNEGDFVRPSPDIFSGERLDRLNSRAEELIDEQFYEFFTHSVVVDQDELDRRMKEERRRKRKERRGFSLFGRRNKEREEQEETLPAPEENPQDEAQLPADIFADAQEQPVRPQPQAIDPDVFAKARERREQAAAKLRERGLAAEEKQPDAASRPSGQKAVTVQDKASALQAKTQDPLPAPPVSPAQAEPAAAAAEEDAAQPEQENKAPELQTVPSAEEKKESAELGEAAAAQAGGNVENEPQEAPREEERFDPLGLAGTPADEGSEEEKDTTEFDLSDQVQEEDAQEEPIEDYDSPSDAPAVQEDLRSLRTSLNLRLVVTLLLGVLGLYLSLTASFSNLPSLPMLDPRSQPMFFLGANAVLLLIAMVVNYNTIASGLSSLWSSPSPDLLAALASISSLIQCGALMTNAKQFTSAGYTVFSSLAILCLAGNTFGKCITARMVSENFEMASAGFDHAAAYQITDPELLKKVTDGLGEPAPHLLVSRPTALVRGFLRQSFSEHRSDRLSKRLGIAALAGAVCCAVIAGVFTKNLYTAISCFAGALALAAPLSSTLVGAIPAGLMQSSAARVGAVVPGPSAVENLRSTNVVLVGARDLFPPATVRLRGIKTFQKERIDLAILYAASILVEGCDTLRDIFLGVVEGKRDMLFPVENLVGETGFGFMGWIDNNRVIVGNREMMTRHGIEIPSMDYEQRYTGEDKLPIYLAVSGRLFGMFLVSYGPDEEMAETVDDLRRAGISLLVRSTDFNVTRELIADCYGISPDSVKVLDAAELTALTPSLSYLPESEGVMTHIGSFASFIGGLRAASAAASAEKSAAALQAVSVILGLVLGLLLAVTTGLGSLSALAILLYHCAWLILIVAVPLLRRY